MSIDRAPAVFMHVCPIAKEQFAVIYLKELGKGLLQKKV
jgi:hypothetical protein